MDITAKSEALQKWLVQDKNIKLEEFVAMPAHLQKSYIQEWHALRGSEMALKLLALRDIVWGEDIASPSCPEYAEHHTSIGKILNAIDNLLMEVD